MKNIDLCQIYLAKATKIALLVFALSFINPSHSLAQEQQDSAQIKLSEIGGIPDTVIEIQPTFKKGDKNTFRKWLVEHIAYPPNARENKTQGQVIVRFVVDTDGKVKDITIVKGLSAELDAEVISAVSKSPKWTPGYSNGRPVRVTYTIPINFSLVTNGFGNQRKATDPWNNQINKNKSRDPRYR
jgi:TonB family protein